MKRGVAKIASRLYNPMGLATLVTVQLKILFLELCQERLDWDEPLPTTLRAKWQAQVDSLQQAPMICVPRYYFSSQSSTGFFSLQGFCDASKVAYAAVVYLLVKSTEVCYTRLVACKTRVVPTHAQTIPRPKLLSAVLLRKLMASVSSVLSTCLELQQQSYYMDSEMALYWIKGHEKKWQLFVQNHVDQIRKVTLVEQWHRCPGTENPADVPSWGADHKLWLQGPEWLRNSSTDQDSLSTKPEMPEECKAEQRGDKKIVVLSQQCEYQWTVVLWELQQ